MRKILLMTGLGLLASPLALEAQDRTRSATYNQTPQDCLPWDVGFDYKDCQRVRFPGPQADYVQVYTKEDGSRENFLTDPGASRPQVAETKETETVPAPTVTTAAPAPAAQPLVVQDPAPVQSERLPTEVTVFPGRTELLPVAVGHLNRIATPFGNPNIMTSASGGGFR